MGSNYSIKYNIDIVMVIDATGSMDSLIGTVKSNALTFYDDLTASMARKSKHVDQVRVRVIVFRDYIADKEPMLAKTPQGYDTVMNTNLKAAYFMCQTIANHMLAKGIKGHILNISSSSSKRPGWGPYQLSKHGLNAMTEGFAMRLAPNGITVNGIAPGITATPMQDGNLVEGSLTYDNPMRRAQAPEEIARAKSGTDEIDIHQETAADG